MINSKPMLCKLHESIPKAIASVLAIEYGYKDVTNYTNDRYVDHILSSIKLISLLKYLGFMSQKPSQYSYVLCKKCKCT